MLALPGWFSTCYRIRPRTTSTRDFTQSACYRIRPRTTSTRLYYRIRPRTTSTRAFSLSRGLLVRQANTIVAQPGLIDFACSRGFRLRTPCRPYWLCPLMRFFRVSALRYQAFPCSNDLQSSSYLDSSQHLAVQMPGLGKEGFYSPLWTRTLSLVLISDKPTVPVALGVDLQEKFSFRTNTRIIE